MDVPKTEMQVLEILWVIIFGRNGQPEPQICGRELGLLYKVCLLGRNVLTNCGGGGKLIKLFLTA